MGGRAGGGQLRHPGDDTRATLRSASENAEQPWMPEWHGPARCCATSRTTCSPTSGRGGARGACARRGVHSAYPYPEKSGGDDPISDSRNGTTSGAGGAGAGESRAAGRIRAGGIPASQGKAPPAQPQGAAPTMMYEVDDDAELTAPVAFFPKTNPNSDDFRENMMTNKNGRIYLQQQQQRRAAARSSSSSSSALLY